MVKSTKPFTMAEQPAGPKITSSGPSSGRSSPDVSNNSSRRNSGSPEFPKQKGTHRVKFSNVDEDSTPKKPIPNIRLTTDGPAPSRTPYLDVLDTDLSTDVTDTPKDLRSPAVSEDEDEDQVDEISRKGKMFSALSAQSRAQQLASLLGSHSAPGSRRNSVETPTPPESTPPMSRSGVQAQTSYPVRLDDIPLVEINGEPRRPYSIHEDSDVDDNDKAKEKLKEDTADENKRRQRARSNAEAHRIVRTMTGRLNPSHSPPADGLKSGQITPVEERDPELYVPRPAEYKAGILASLLKLQEQQNHGSNSDGRSLGGHGRSHHSRSATGDSATLSVANTPGSSPTSSGYNTPKGRRPKWYDQKSPRHSVTSLAGLVNASTMLASPAASTNTGKPTRPQMHGRSHSSNLVSAALNKIHRPRLEDEIRITVHIAEVLARQKFLLKLTKALMMFGAPTHRLEEYLRMCARVLQIEGQFLYIPGCMIISFDDSTTHTAEVKIVKVVQGVDLGRLKDVHQVMKSVLHDMMGVEEATQALDDISRASPRFNRWILILAYGFASAFVGPYAFGARPIDMPICFLLGIILGVLQLVVAPKSDLYANVFEISATVLTSFLARAFGSIYSKSTGTPYFCFSAIAQSSIALILPGYIILCGSLELQSKNLVAGSVRMVYAIIYSLMLGFGITIGTTIYGLMDSNATSSYTCPDTPWWNDNAYLSHFPFVPLFTICLIIINQAKWTQAPAMILIAFAGYQVNFWSSKRFSSNVQVADALGAFAIGVLGNLYSRLRHGVAAAAILPAIYVSVPVSGPLFFEPLSSRPSLQN